MVFHSHCLASKPSVKMLERGRREGRRQRQSGGRGSNRWQFAPGAFHAVRSASGGVSANLHSLACFEEKFTAEGMSASTRGCRELGELWFQAVFL